MFLHQRMAFLNEKCTLAKNWLAIAAVCVFVLSNPVFHAQGFKAVADGPQPNFSCFIGCGVKVIQCSMGCVSNPVCFIGCGIDDLSCIGSCNQTLIAESQIRPVLEPITMAKGREGDAGTEMHALEAVEKMISSAGIGEDGVNGSLEEMAKIIASAYTSGVPGPLEATAKITSSAGTTKKGVKGSLQFLQDSTGKIIHIKGTIVGLSPGIHELSIHSDGTCSSNGPRFHPFNKVRGAPWGENHHAFDVGNIVAGPDGIAEVSIKSETIQPNGVSFILGWAILVRDDTNDVGSVENKDNIIPRNLGAAVGCGIIEIKPTI